MKKRIVVTGMGVVAPNAIGIDAFTEALKNATSGITHHQQLADLNFSCQIGGIPNVTEALKQQYFSALQLRGFNSSGILYGCIAGIDAWKDAGFEVSQDSLLDEDTGVVFGAGASSVDKFREAIYKVDEKQVRRLGSTVVVQTMASGISAYLGGMLGLGNQVTTNSAACATGVEGILMGYDRIQSGRAKRMLVGSCSNHGPYIWAGFDAMRVMNYKHNTTPQEGSRPMSATASGFVPGAGAGALVLEDLDSALQRKATIYAEVLGGAINSGGQRQGGTLTAPNSNAVVKCIRKALEYSNTSANAIDVINGHLTATAMDSTEIRNWTVALNRQGRNFPYINATKSLVGHCLAASGAIESVASIIQLKDQFIAPNRNCDDLHPDIANSIAPERVPMAMKKQAVNIIAKSSFGFGDVNACILFKRYKT